MRARQGEGWPAGDRLPELRHLNEVTVHEAAFPACGAAQPGKA